MPPADLIIRSRRVVTPEGERHATIHIRNGVIVRVAAHDDVPRGCQVHDAGKHVVMPGLVDSHVHINEPGRTHWEGFETATRAAAAGGITTLIEMPLNSIPATTTAAAFRKKCQAARGKLHVDVGFWGGVVPGNADELRALWDAGVFGFKCFLVPSGVDEFRHVTEADLRLILPILKKLGAPLLVHSELPGRIEKALAAMRQEDPRRYRTWLRSRPPQAEKEAIALLIRLCREFRARIHVVHLSTAEAVPLLRRARQQGLPVTVETCPHYLFFSSGGIQNSATEFKCAPPIRDERNRRNLWQALRSGVIDFVVTDHSPAPPEMKCRATGDFQRAWGGIASLQLGLPTMWTLLRERGTTSTLEHLVRWMCAGPAKLAGLEKRKGSIAAGYDADVVIWDPEARFPVRAKRLHHRHKLTPYAGEILHGVVQTTFLRGRKIYDHGEFPCGPVGAILTRGKP